MRLTRVDPENAKENAGHHRFSGLCFFFLSFFFFCCFGLGRCVIYACVCVLRIYIPIVRGCRGVRFALHRRFGHV